jgi:hypothetical protein
MAGNGHLTGTFKVNSGMAQMLRGRVIMDVVNVEQGKIAEEAGAVVVMVLESSGGHPGAGRRGWRFVAGTTRTSRIFKGMIWASVGERRSLGTASILPWWPHRGHLRRRRCREKSISMRSSTTCFAGP